MTTPPKVSSKEPQFSLDFSASLSNQPIAKSAPPTRTRELDRLEKAAQLLEASKDFQVLRRLRPREISESGISPGARVGVFVDCETEGLDDDHKIIELGLVRFQFEPNSGRLIGLLAPADGYSALEDPGRPIDPYVQKLTGLSDGDVAGQRIDDETVSQLINDATIVIAHNARFDRPRIERRFPIFATKRWACSMRDIDWESEGVGSAKLDYLAYVFRFFFDGHRAASDCFAGLEVLSRRLPETGEFAFKRLLGNCNQVIWRHFVDPKFGMNERLKQMRYRWCGPERRSSWYRDFTSKEEADQSSFDIQNEGLGKSSQILELTSIDRYSKREFQGPN